MLLKFFKGTSPAVIFIISVAFAAVWISAFLNPVPAVQNYSDEMQMPLYSLLINLIGKDHFATVFLSLSVAVLLVFLIINFNTDIFFINERTFLPALLYIMVIAIFPEYQMLNPALPASLLLMLALKRIMAGYHKQGVAYNFFDAGILISTGSLFYANLIWFGAVVFIGIVLLRTVSLSEIAVTLLGLITPYLITFGLLYVLGNDPDELMTLIYDNLFSVSTGYSFPRLTIVTLVFEAIIILISIGYIIMLQNTKKIKSRKTFTLLIWIFIISLIVYLAVPSSSVEIIWIAGIPVSYFLSHQFIYGKRKIVSEIFFSALLVLVLLIQSLYIFL
jgi:hypothetical protein